jgi:hypothetical protein
MEMKEKSGTARTKNVNEGNVRNCTDKEMEKKEMSGIARTKKWK